MQRELRWWHGWMPLVVGPAAVALLVPPAWPQWALMWALAFVIFCGCKWLTWRRGPRPGAPRWRHAGYLVGWPGLDAASFLNPNPTPPAVSPSGAGVGLRRVQERRGRRLAVRRGAVRRR